MNYSIETDRCQGSYTSEYSDYTAYRYLIHFRLEAKRKGENKFTHYAGTIWANTTKHEEVYNMLVKAMGAKQLNPGAIEQARISLVTQEVQEVTILSHKARSTKKEKLAQPETTTRQEVVKLDVELA